MRPKRARLAPHVHAGILLLVSTCMYVAAHVHAPACRACIQCVYARALGTTGAHTRVDGTRTHTGSRTRARARRDMLGASAPGVLLGHNNAKQKIQYHLRLKQVREGRVACVCL